MKRIPYFLLLALFVITPVFAVHAQTSCTCQALTAADQSGPSVCNQGNVGNGNVGVGGSCTNDTQCSGTNICMPAGPSAGGATAGASAGGANTGASAGGATTPSNTGGIALTNPLNAANLQQLLGEILGYVQTLGGIFLVIMLVYVGFLFVAARGNDEKIRSARTALMWTVVGGLLLLGASALAQVIGNTVTSL